MILGLKSYKKDGFEIKYEEAINFFYAPIIKGHVKSPFGTYHTHEVRINEARYAFDRKGEINRILDQMIEKTIEELKWMAEREKKWNEMREKFIKLRMDLERKTGEAK